jgi:hypothetical protein
MSYSHDSERHKGWVLSLATRLVSNGVDIILDQWDLTLGSDLPAFIESGFADADRLIAICTNHYVEKANRGTGGVGYEKMILTAQLMENINTDRIIPLIRNNDIPTPTPSISGKIFCSSLSTENWCVKFTVKRSNHDHRWGRIRS